ncbi:hypothetical protein PWEIH_16593 [Listeria weihenstephanensis FSL R9-0317]|uniref:Uncharacterized protein n=1 Tax=Listeria weihenstephanensis TaxID=1006155 RepID=A0A1S7FW08_9LIST|nr:DUF3130 family protein [Listeria weihenstephanensis]AQY51613.1 hypothetical protein UE46_11600 [Listeria weihenstephanensis]EUJ34866.1 hypothetical protein PWEIH_16593 [Listeria weihenstephanensis FSL R9-0317]
MSKEIQLPSGPLAEHATNIGKNTEALALKIEPQVAYSTGTAQELVYDCMEMTQFLQAFPSVFTTDVQNLKNVEKAFVASEKHIASMLQTGVDFTFKK